MAMRDNVLKYIYTTRHINRMHNRKQQKVTPHEIVHRRITFMEHEKAMVS